MIDGWVWPLKDQKCWPWLQREHDLPALISAHCKEQRVVLEAGGNAGFYVKKYAELFNSVYTFEPDNLNFQCLVANVKEKNVFKFQSCIGYDRNLVSMVSSNRNIGMYHINLEESGFITTIQIDDLNLPVCDLIHLDIEGFEFEALKGGIETIKRCKPVIALEWMNHGERYGNPDEKIEQFLTELGYTSVDKVYHENIFVFKE
jgi:FkbM family methyltransferase